MDLLRKYNVSKERGGEERIDLDSCLPIPPNFAEYPNLYHGTQSKLLRYILKPSGGLLPGGSGGAEARGNVYWSLADMRRYEKGYRPKFQQFRKVRKEPTPWKFNSDCVVTVNHQALTQSAGTAYQSGSLAGISEYGKAAPFDCISEVSDMKGWLIYEQPAFASNPWDLIAGGNSSPSASPRNAPPATTSAIGICRKCKIPGIEGQVYCLLCWRVLPGAIERNI